MLAWLFMGAFSARSDENNHLFASVSDRWNDEKNGSYAYGFCL
jgi:hypothetical protein